MSFRAAAGPHGHGDPAGLLGGGTRLVDGLAEAPVTLGTPRVVESAGVTHLYFPVRP
jgi:hypothetical protein